MQIELIGLTQAPRIDHYLARVPHSSVLRIAPRLMLQYTLTVLAACGGIVTIRVLPRSWILSLHVLLLPIWDDPGNASLWPNQGSRVCVEVVTDDEGLNSVCPPLAKSGGRGV